VDGRLTRPRFGIEQDGNRTVVYQADLHRSLEDPGFHWYLRSPRNFDKVVVQIAGLAGRRCLVETGSAAFSAIAIECELGYDQQRTGRFPNVAIHLAGIIREDAQAKNLIQKIVRVGLAIWSRNTKKYYQSRTYRSTGTAIHLYAGFCHSLNDGSHVCNRRSKTGRKYFDLDTIMLYLSAGENHGQEKP
jgi:hypothetical protein